MVAVVLFGLQLELNEILHHCLMIHLLCPLKQKRKINILIVKMQMVGATLSSQCTTLKNNFQILKLI